MNRRVAARVLVAALTLGVVVTAPSLPSAAEQVDVGAGSADLADALRRDLGIPVDEMQSRFARVGVAAQAEQVLRANIGASFAGAWLAAEDQRLVVAITDPSKAWLVRDQGAEPRLVARNEG